MLIKHLVSGIKHLRTFFCDYLFMQEENMKYFVMEFYRIQEKKILKAFLGEEKKEEFFGPCEG